MIWLSSSTLTRLRDRLKERGEPPSVLASDSSLGLEAVLAKRLVEEYGPLCEAMYLMMSADGSVGDAEREVLRGALRRLSDDTIRTAQIEAMLDSASSNVAAEGREARLDEVARQLAADPVRAEVAFVLAAAIAFADNAIADEENETLNDLAARLGLDEERANQLLDDVEADLAAAPKPTS